MFSREAFTVTEICQKAMQPQTFILPSSFPIRDQMSLKPLEKLSVFAMSTDYVFL